MNILVTLNRHYIQYLLVMLRSLLDNNKEEDITCYVLSNDMTQEDLISIRAKLKTSINLHLIDYQNKHLDQAKTTYRYPKEVYYRLYAAQYLPKNLDRILYLDVDIIVLKNLEYLYQMDFSNNYFIGATNIKRALTTFNNIKNQAPLDAHYLNTGVLLINLKLLREQQEINELNDYIIKNQHKLFLPDQDVLNALYGNKVKLIDHMIFNLSDRAITKYNLSIKNKEKVDMQWVEENAVILHFYGKNKPWKEDYKGILKCFYDYYADASFIDHTEIK